MGSHRHAHGHSHDAPGHAHGRESHDHGHAHDHERHTTTLLAIAFALTLGFMLVEFAGGLLAGSLALLADAGHMLTDAAALALAWAASRFASRPADARRSFGYQRLRVIATFVNGFALLLIVAWIVVEAVQRLIDPQPVHAQTVIWIGSLGFAVNLFVFAMLRRGDAHDMNVTAATLHVLGDLLGSVAAVAAALVILLTGWTAADPISSLIVSALILRGAWALVRRSTHILMEGSPEGVDVEELRRTLEQRIPAIVDVHHVHLWLVGPHEKLMTMHATVSPGVNQATVLRDTKAILEARFGITHTTIQIEVEGCADEDCVKTAGH